MLRFLLFLCVLCLIGCKEQYKYFTDSKGREHCQDLKTGKFVDDKNCQKFIGKE